MLKALHDTAPNEAVINRIRIQKAQKQINNQQRAVSTSYGVSIYNTNIIGVNGGEVSAVTTQNMLKRAQFQEEKKSEAKDKARIPKGRTFQRMKQLVLPEGPEEAPLTS